MLEFKLPEVGENITSGTVVSIFVKPGDTIKADQDLLELETDKASLPIPAPCAGIISEVLINEGDEVAIGQVVFKIDANGASAPATEKEEPKTAVASTPKEAPKPIAQPQVQSSTPAPIVAALPNTSIPAQNSVAAAPSVRRLSRQLGINISLVPGSGPGGRITKDDVKAYTKQIVLSGGGASVAKTTRPLPAFEKFGSVNREKMSKIRKVTAEHLSFCWQTIPHVTQFAKVDITELDKLRKSASTKERKITVTPFLMKVMASALKEFPQFNASIDMENQEIIYKDYFNIGVAVDTERGLLVPVIKDVDKKSIFELTDELNEMAERARNKRTSLEELQGGSMTLTNLGGIGGTAFTPIVNWPEVAILGVSRGGLEPKYENGEFTPRLTLPLSLSYDHRVIDGANGARFIKWVCDAIEQSYKMDLDK